MNRIRVLVLAAGISVTCSAFSAEQQTQNKFFLPQNPVAAAYVLGRLSNQELIDAPRSEFVYVALLQRQGLSRKYRLEALVGLAQARHTTQMDELLRAITELDAKGSDFQDSLRDLAGVLLQFGKPELSSKQSQLEQLALHSQLPISRQMTWATLWVLETDPGAVWKQAEPDPGRMEDLLLSVSLIPDQALREQFYSRVQPLLRADAPPTLIRAAAAAIVSIPGHETETFKTLAALVRANVEPQSAIASLARIPRNAWPKETLAPLSQSLLEYLQKVPSEQRADTPFAEALQFANELASLLPKDAGQTLTRTLRNLGPTVVTLHAVYEQMRFDKDLVVVECGKPVVFILQNEDAMPHNLAILAPGALKEVGMAAEKMAPEPDSEGRLYVPASPKVLHATRLVPPGQKLQLSFNAPPDPGDYPFVCTFPGHWLRMSGNLAVVPDVDAYLASHTNSQTITEWKLADFSSDLTQAGLNRDLLTGKELFSKLACVQCHKLGPQGYAFGPDLTEVFQRYKQDRGAVLQQILEPSKTIEERYRNFNFQLVDGDSQLGMILKEDDQNVTIQTGPADSLIQVIKKSEIKQRRPQPSSPMPVGLLNSLSKDQIFDLLAYLESGGKTGSAHDHHH